MSKRSAAAVLVTVLGMAIGASNAVADQDDDQESFVVIKAGRIVTNAGPDLAMADILLVDGKVRLVGKDLSYPTSTKVIDAQRYVVTPGLIHPHTRWQLPSYTRSGTHGDRLVGQEIYLDQLQLEPLLEAGFTTVCFYPSGTGIAGRAAIYRVTGPASAGRLGDGYLCISMTATGRDKATLRDAVKKATSGD